MLEVRAGLCEGIAAELFEPGIGEHDRDHRLSDDAGGGHDTDIAALVVREHLLAGIEVHGWERVGERGDGFDGGAHDDLLAGADAALDAAVAVGRVAPRLAAPFVHRAE